MSPTMQALLCLYVLVVYTCVTTGVTISNVGTDLVWSDDHGLDMRGHCSFTFSVGFCGAFRLELYPDKSLSLPKYEIFIDRDSFQRYKVGIKKYCDPERLLCTNNGMGTSGHESTPLVTCAGSTWTPFWISWNEATVRLGKGETVGTFVLKEVNDPEFKHIDYVKMGADDMNTNANFRFELRTGRPDNPDMTCREDATTTAVVPTSTDGPVKHGAAIPATGKPPTDGPVKANEAITPVPTTTTTEGGDLDSHAQASETEVRMTGDNCDSKGRPESENRRMVFKKVANNTTLSPSNPDVEDLDSTTSGSCAELCTSRQTCVLYSISITGTCRITSTCRPEVVSETGSVVLFLKYWG